MMVRSTVSPVGALAPARAGGPTIHIGTINIGSGGASAGKEFVAELRRRGWAVTA